MSNAIQKAVNKQDVLATLQVMLVAAQAKLQTYRYEINQQFSNPPGEEKGQIPVIKTIKFIEQYHVASSQILNVQFQGHTNRAANTFFTSSWGLNAVINLLVIKTFETLISHSSWGKTEDKAYFIIPENNALLRVDICIWLYKMTDSQVMENQDVAVAYLVCKSTVDHNKLTLNELEDFISKDLAKISKNLSYREGSLQVKNNPDNIDDNTVKKVKRYLDEITKAWKNLNDEGAKPNV